MKFHSIRRKRSWAGLSKPNCFSSFLMNSGSRPCAPRYFEVDGVDREPPCACPRAAEIAALPTGDARGRAGVGAGELRDDALDRPAGRELHHDERHQHDPEQGRDHEQEAADDVGGHRSRSVRSSRSADTMRLHAVSLACFDLGRLVAIVPPGFRHAAGIARLGRRPAEHVPIGDPVRRLVPVRDPVAAGADHPVERAAGGGQLRPRRRPR